MRLADCQKLCPATPTIAPEKMVKYTIMTYEISYRNKDGKIEQMQLDASDRSAVFAELSKRGITAIRIEEATGKKKPRKPANSKGGKSPAIGKGIVAGAVVVAAAVGAWYFLLPKTETPVENKEKKPATIAATAPSLPTPAKVTEEKPKPEPVQMVTNRHGKVVQRKKPETYVDAAGVERYVKGNGRVPLKNPEKYLVKSVVHPNAYPDFKHDCENEIANLLTIESGGMIFGDREYDKRFEQDFVQALMEPVEITEEDSEEDRRIKENVEAVKHELAERIKQGENLGDILTAEREEIRRLAQYKQQMEELFHEQLSTGEIQTEQDLDDFCKAVNTMLESKGIEPFKISGLMRRRLGLDRAKNQDKQKK